MKKNQSFRSKVLVRRSYNRPTNDEGTEFESWPDTVDRVIGHQRWLWERQLKTTLNFGQLEELEELRDLMLGFKATVSGRTLWLGGTDTAKTCEASQFNCAGTVQETCYDMVDTIWLLMQGCGVGGLARLGTLSGFRKKHEIEIIRSTRTDKGNPKNAEFVQDGVWTIKVGDSAKAWSKAVGKILVGKKDVHKIVIDFSEVRPSGTRLKGYGWISSGDNQISIAFEAICRILNTKADQLLDNIDMLDISTWLGTILSSRRSAEILLQEYNKQGWENFVEAKKENWKCNQCGSHNTTALEGCADCGAKDTNRHREQSNNSLLFEAKPTHAQLTDIFARMEDAGGSEPGFINAAEARRRAPWFSTFNPCVEIILANKGFCNLIEINVAAFDASDNTDLLRAIYIMARANYRQTCVNLRDGILQEAWHTNNEFLRLCGVGLTGIVQRPDLENAELLQKLRAYAQASCHSMADELGTPRAKNVTTIKPSGTLGKVMDATEGLHKPLGKYIFNWVGFGIHDPLVEPLKAAGHKWITKPSDPDTIVICFPVEYDGCEFTEVNGTEVNLESAIKQLDRYKLFNENWTDHNSSVTISYDLGEVEDIVNWLLENWDSYVGVSFMYRNDPTKTAKDLGYEYLPQEVVTKEAYLKYTATLKDFDLDDYNSHDLVDDGGCGATGICPMR